MQLCALNSQNQLVFARQASKQTDYACLECGQKIRLRSGVHRQAHFYHIQSNYTCTQHAKGMTHLMLQQFLKETLPFKEVLLEHRFESIARIADVVWLSRHIIFEIQCSPITPEEIESRNADYYSIGYQVIWIFHDSLYNQKRISAAELAMRKAPHYFSNMDRHGVGCIYDQPALTYNGMRIHSLPRLPINPSMPHTTIVGKNSKSFQKLPFFLKDRALKWPMGFSGDCMDRYFQLTSEGDEKNSLDMLLNGEIKNLFEQQRKRQAAKKILFGFSNAYRSLFRLFLERACR